MNLVVSLAVGDVDELRNTAEELMLKIKVYLIYRSINRISVEFLH
jgi:hypothetical protein